MKTKILLSILYLSTLAGYVLAQLPGFNYQAVLRSVDGEPMANADVKIFFNLTDGPEGQVLYRESHSLVTNELGMINTVVGTGNVEMGTFEDIVSVQNLNVKLEAEIPGEPNIVDVGFGVVGAVPYALYGEDADADPENEMQSLSVEGDSLKISKMGGTTLNRINYWNRDDTSYYIIEDDFGRDVGDNRVNFNTSGSSNEGITFEMKDDGWAKRQSVWGETIISPGGVVADKGILRDPENELSNEQRNCFSMYYPNFLLQNIVGAYSISPFVSQIALRSTGLGYLAMLWKSGLYVTGMDQDADGCNLFTGYNGSKLFNLFSDIEQGGVGADLYKIGINQFGMGFGVFCPPEEAKRSNGSVATFGGTFSTANDDGLTTLMGYLPSSDPTNAVNVLFNGANLGVVANINTESAATTSTYGANGQTNTTSGTFAGAPDHGVHMVFGDAGGSPTAYMRSTANGSEVAANIMTMLSAAPGRSDRDATFAAPMGGEAAAYDRGTAQMVNGEATVICPEHFQWVADEASMTVTITPLSAESKGVAVIEKSNGGFKVKELHGGTGNYAFDYLVMCKRKGYEDFQVLRKKPEMAPSHDQKILDNLPKGPIKSIRDLGRKSD